MPALDPVAAAVGAAAGLLVATGLVACLARVVVQPLRRIALIADQLTGGRPDPRLLHTGLGEISRLGRQVHILGASVGRGLGGLAQLVEAQTALRRVAVLVARGVGPAEVFDAVTGELGRLIGADGANIVRFEPDGAGVIVAHWGWPGPLLPDGTRITLDGMSVTGTVRRTGRAARLDTYDTPDGPLATFLRAHGIRSAVGAPIHVEGRLWGAVTASMVRAERLPPDTEARLADCTDLVATAIANAQARTELLDSRARLVLATDEARRRLERDLHDGVQQRLLALGIELRAAQEAVPGTLTDVRARLSAVQDALTAGIDELREISRGIHPTILTDRGLPAAVKALARRSPVAVEATVRLRARLPEPLEVAAYAVVAESLANAAAHAGATLVRITLTADDARLHLLVRDDGTGGADPARGSGLLGISDRVHALGGSLTLTSLPGEGTTLAATLPLPPP